jgi:hypothetical protein
MNFFVVEAVPHVLTKGRTTLDRRESDRWGSAGAADVASSVVRRSGLCEDRGYRDEAEGKAEKAAGKVQNTVSGVKESLCGK